MKSSIAIIPARGGSKRIPRKNIKSFLGKPIIAYSIEAAIKSKIFQKVMVSTDDNQIAEISRKYGADVPFLRSKKNSDDHAVTADVLEEVLREYEKRGIQYSYICCIYPTSPFTTTKLLKKSKKMLIQSRVDSVIPIVRYSYPIQRALKKDHDDIIDFINPENINKRSQDFTLSYHDAGQFYWLNVFQFKRQKRLFMNRTLGIELFEGQVQDIDVKDDWNIAEMKYRFFINEKNK